MDICHFSSLFFILLGEKENGPPGGGVWLRLSPLKCGGLKDPLAVFWLTEKWRRRIGEIKTDSKESALRKLPSNSLDKNSGQSAGHDIDKEECSIALSIGNTLNGSVMRGACHAISRVHSKNVLNER